MLVVDPHLIPITLQHHQELMLHYQQAFQHPAHHAVYAPARIEVLGNHTDYNQGQVLSMAIDRYISIYCRPIAGHICTWINPQVQGEEIAHLNINCLDQVYTDQLSWLNYVRGIMQLLQKEGWEIPAFEAYVHSDIPLSAGLSSSAALEMACVTLLEKLCQKNFSVYQKARLGQMCEEFYIGARTGLMDQFTILSAQKDHLLWSEYANLSRQDIPFPTGHTFVLIDSHVKHDLTSAYNDRRASCELVLSHIQKSKKIASLSELSLDDLHSYRSQLPLEDYRKAQHVIGENDRVKQAIEALQSQDMMRFGRLLFESHESSRVLFENSCPQLDALVQYAQDHNDVLGARLSGGGFGGMSIHLLTQDRAENYSKAIQQAFPYTDHERLSLLCQSAQGVYCI